MVQKTGTGNGLLRKISIAITIVVLIIGATWTLSKSISSKDVVQGISEQELKTHTEVTGESYTAKYFPRDEGIRLKENVLNLDEDATNLETDIKKMKDEIVDIKMLLVKMETNQKLILKILDK